ncbi:MAG: helix-turn-helix domain-containing protein [Pirellulales bacterium]
MSARVQSLNLAGKRFVVLELDEYERLRALERGATPVNLPPWPPADAAGNRPALEFMRVSIARDIIQERAALGLTQDELAKLAGIRQETLCRLETGKQAPNMRTVEKIDRALKRAAVQQTGSRRPVKKSERKGLK